MAHDIKAIGETECVEFVIPNGQDTYIYTLLETYATPPSATLLIETGGPDYDMTITNTEITVVYSHTNGASGEIIVFVQNNL